MLIVAATLAGVLTVPLFSGRFQRLTEARLHHAWTLPTALAAQILITSVHPDLPVVLARGVHVASYALAIAFLVANRRLAGLWVVGAGTAANLLVISINGGVMPAAAGALRRAGLMAQTDQFANSARLADPHLAFLGDVFAIPSGMPFANVFSVGDVLVVIGAIMTVHALCGSHVGARHRKVPVASLDQA